MWLNTVQRCLMWQFFLVNTCFFPLSCLRIVLAMGISSWHQLPFPAQPAGSILAWFPGFRVCPHVYVALLVQNSNNRPLTTVFTLTCPSACSVITKLNLNGLTQITLPLQFQQLPTSGNTVGGLHLKVLYYSSIIMILKFNTKVKFQCRCDQNVQQECSRSVKHCTLWPIK